MYKSLDKSLTPLSFWTEANSVRALRFSVAKSLRSLDSKSAKSLRIELLSPDLRMIYGSRTFENELVIYCFAA